ncbi:hypothetical protein PR003_g27307, partial [Phytophthora rubi]
MTLELQPGESCGYWKYHVPGKHFKQAKANSKINNVRTVVLLDSGSEVSIIDATFARKVGCYIDTSQSQECLGIGEKLYVATGRTKIKLTLAGSLVYLYEVWVGDDLPPDYQAILGMDFMVPAGIRLDLGDGSMCLPDEIRVMLHGRRQIFSDKARPICVGEHLTVGIARSVELPLRLREANNEKLWLTKGQGWVPTLIKGPGRLRYLHITNLSDRTLILQRDVQIGLQLSGYHVPRQPGYVSVGSRRYAEWQTLAWEATTDATTVTAAAQPADDNGPAVDRVEYPTPRQILARPQGTATTEQRDAVGDGGRAVATCVTRSGTPPAEEISEAGLGNSPLHVEIRVGACRPTEEASVIADMPGAPADTAREGAESGEREDDSIQSDEVSDREPVHKAELQAEEVTQAPAQGATKQIPLEDRRASVSAPSPGAMPPDLLGLASEDPEPNPDPDTRRGEPDGGSEATIEVRIEDLQVGDLADNTEEEIRKLQDIIWTHRHLLIGKGNALPPAAVGAICDIDVGDAAPIAQRVRKIAPRFREKVSDLLKGLLSAKIIRHSTSPWASPIVVIIKKNGVDIRLCIDYRLVNGLTKLMIYPMPLINDLLEDLDKVLWYCSLDMASGFWVVSMTDRARAISAFITPFGLFEWNRMPFGLKNAPQIYQRPIDNALYGFLRIPPAADQSTLTGLFKEGDPEEAGESSVLGRRSYIDDILVTAGSGDLLCDRVKALLEACDKCNISISVAKSFWGLKKVDYLGHRVSNEGLESHPKDLSALTDLPFPRTLRAMQSFLVSLNYYGLFIEDMAIYASVLYELREVDFAAFRDQAGCERVGPTITPGEDQQNNQATADPKWDEAKAAFSELKRKIAATPILRHFDAEKRPVVIIYASEWAVSASLVQDHDGTYLPVMFTSRTLKKNELNYGIVEKEVLALLRMLDLGYSMLAGRPIQVLARHSTLV